VDAAAVDVVADAAGAEDNRWNQSFILLENPMLRINKLALVASLILPVYTHASSLVDVFGHNFTGRKNDPVWTVKQESGHFTLITHGDGSTSPLRVLSKAEITRFWKKMLWEQESSKKAECLGSRDEILCFVPTQSRKSIPYLEDNTSDYFYYDKMAGIMEIYLISE